MAGATRRFDGDAELTCLADRAGDDCPGVLVAVGGYERIDIPAIDAHATMMTLGKRRDGTIQVPPHEKHSRAGWYENSPTPGQIGPAIVLGHVDSKKHGPAVFYRLGTLDRGDRVDITRADGTVARFRVDKVATYKKNRFPTERIYGATDHAALRLITCGGRFDPPEGSYENNIVAYASLTGEPRRPTRQ